MITAEVARHTLDLDVRELHVHAAAQLLKAVGFVVAEFPIHGYGTPPGGLRVASDGDVLVLACELDSESGSWWWLRPAAGWRCPARDLDWLLRYVQAVLGRTS